MRALLVDDDGDLARLLVDYFAPHGVALSHVESGAQAESLLGTETFDVVLLDVMLPGMDGFEVCRRIRISGDVPIVMLTARGDDTDRIVGLELGADDYVPKPFNPRELLARMRAVLRRGRHKSSLDVIRTGSLEIDVPGHSALLDGRSLALTSFEFRVLVALARRVGETVPREELASAVKGGEYDPSVDRSLDVHVSHLRQKLGDDAREPRTIRTVRGKGYVLVRRA
jgi:two-component system, OmpR family, phosphate regulon response regulator OmpR